MIREASPGGAGRSLGLGGGHVAMEQRETPGCLHQLPLRDTYHHHPLLAGAIG
jgi:hypothetical protein